MKAYTNSSACYKQTSSGFTLIELMITIAIMAIIVSIAAPSISTQLANQRVKSTIATLSNALKEAKAESVIRRKSIKMTYHNNGASTGTIKIEQGSTEIASYNYDSKVTISDSADKTTITFETNKRVDANTYTICDRNTAATSRQITVNEIANITNRIGGTC